MYEKAIEVAKDKLLFRAMIPDESREILISGTYHVSNPSKPGAPTIERISHAGSHLTCFAGGMFALGAKLFDRKKDLDIAAKLTDGCVWAYEATNTGIMPETFVAIACDDRKNCPWNENKWWDEVDPHAAWREESYQSQMKVYYEQLAEQKAAMAKKTESPVAVSETSASAAVKTPEPEVAPVKESKLKSSSNMEKRQLGGIPENGIDSIPENGLAANFGKKVAGAKVVTLGTKPKEAEAAWSPPSLTKNDPPPAIYSPEKPMSHVAFAKKKIEEDRIPPGMRSMQDRRYILR
jgi:mannosyl-oligosaccharide alpha-1,2-mannosidase